MSALPAACVVRADPARTREALQFLANSSSLKPRPLAVAALVGVLEQRAGRYSAALKGFDELWRIPTAKVDTERACLQNHLTLEVALKCALGSCDRVTRALVCHCANRTNCVFLLTVCKGYS